MRENRKYKNLSFTFDEWTEFECKAKEVNMRTATYIKAMALRGKIVNVDLSAAHDVVVAINKIGNNVNQIARFANQTGFITASEYNQLMKWRDELSHILKVYLSTIQSKVA